MKKIIPVITIDGPSGVGKSTLTYAISKKLKWHILESGYMYRITAFFILKYNLSLNKKIIFKLENLKFNFKIIRNELKIFFHDIDISNKIHSQKISMMASKIAKLPYIREWLLHTQRSYKKFPGLVTNGRDMGTIVFPDAILKIFLKTKFKIRLKRRFIDLQNRGFKIDLKTLNKELKKRDYQDENRIICPLKPAKDAIIINSTNMNFKETVQVSMKYIYKKLKML
ncbi:(d)CMP kinase [Buchnera aphidicola]|uniref:(d)CMP kinase n=1 Tax=Buchnera aphidicola TaxID=9 RepID=UPI0022378CBB|nr:(d)CMP kinase [Buchnera aphidicola]MCW5197710.1 (d)CMP kinase [Buchnera aphidicola (Chaitophorus viminalis)]